MTEPRHPVSFRFAPPFVERLEKAAEASGLPKHTLAQKAIEAAVAAIEQAGGKLVVPVEFVVRSVPTDNPEALRARRPRARNAGAPSSQASKKKE